MPSQPVRALIAVAAAAVVAVGAWQGFAVSEVDVTEQTSFGPGPMCCIG